mmetsp:Transcript_72002/g.156319  ORF Transcript_72002/g.156319 Transcript_72002/m.156319 type:complete len:106 (+) Transcript_72002:269-586(+)
MDFEPVRLLFTFVGTEEVSAFHRTSCEATCEPTDVAPDAFEDFQDSEPDTDTVDFEGGAAVVAPTLDRGIAADAAPEEFEAFGDSELATVTFDSEGGAALVPAFC